MNCNREGQCVLDREGSAEAFRGRSRLHVRGKPRLEGRLHEAGRPFTLTYHIHPEARWSDGVPVTAQDFIFTLQAIRRHATPEFRDLHAPIRSARAVDRKTVRVVLRPRSASWPDFFGSILPSHALRGSDLTQVWSDRVDDPRTGRAIGSGPFLVERLERGRQLVLRRNPRYWGPHPAYVERLVIRFALSPTDPSDELRSGELDVAMGVPPAVVPAVRRQPGMRLVAARGTNFEHLDVQLGPNAHPALRNKLVRRALAYGIDRATLVRQIWGEVDSSARALDSAVHLAQSRYYEPNWGAYRYRPAEARRLLEQAGCRRGADGVFSCGGERLSLRFVTSPVVTSRAQALPLIQAQLRAAGVEVVPVFAAPPAFFGQILPQGAFDVALFSWAGSPAASWAGVYGCDAPQNYTGYCQRLVTATSTRPTGSSTRVDTPVSSTEPTGGSRVTSRRSRSTSSSLQQRTTPLSGTSCSSPGTRSGTRRTGGSRSSTRSGDRRLAPRRLGSGRLRHAGAERGRSVRLRTARRAAVPQPIARAMLRTGRAAHAAVPRRESPRARVRRRPRLHVAATARLRRHVHEEAAVHAHVPDSASGEVERRRARHGPRLRLHAPRQDRPQGRARPGGAGGRRAGAERLCRRREDRSGRAARVDMRAGAPSSGTSCRGTRSRARSSGASGPTESSTRRRAGRSGAGHSSSGAGSAASS